MRRHALLRALPATSRTTGKYCASVGNINIERRDQAMATTMNAGSASTSGNAMSDCVRDHNPSSMRSKAGTNGATTNSMRNDESGGGTTGGGNAGNSGTSGSAGASGSGTGGAASGGTGGDNGNGSGGGNGK
jgi:hypothetical protein